MLIPSGAKKSPPGQPSVVQSPQPHSASLAIPESLQKLATRLEVSRGQMLFYEGDDSQYLFQVLSGTVKEYAITVDGCCQILDFHFKGDLFGAADEQGHPCSAQAVTKSVLLRFPKQGVERLLQSDAEVSALYMSAILRKLRGAVWQSVTLGQRSATTRLKSFLCLLAERIGDRTKNAWRVELSMRRQDIAEYLGLTIETVSRQMSLLKSNGTILKAEGRRLTLDPLKFDDAGVLSERAMMLH